MGPAVRARAQRWPWNPEAIDKPCFRDEYQRVALALQSNREAGGPPGGVLFSSAQTGEGVSTAVLGVGRELYRSLGLRPLLVELNRLRPCFSERLHLDSERSVNGMITRSAGLMDCVQRESTGLALLPSGGDWSGTSVAQVACRIQQAAAGNFDLVLFDMPPMFESVDTLAAGSVVDDLVVVIRGGRTSSEVLGRIRRQTEKGGPKIVGSILTMQQRVLPRWLDRWLEG